MSCIARLVSLLFRTSLRCTSPEVDALRERVEQLEADCRDLVAATRDLVEELKERAPWRDCHLQEDPADAWKLGLNGDEE
jgi:hypothetical protein